MKKNFESNLINLMMLFIGIALFISAQSIKAGATNSLGGDFVPKLSTGLWVVVSALLFVTGLKNSETGSKQMNLTALLKTFVLLIINISLLKTLGFIICSVLYLGVQMYLFLPKELHSKKNYILLVILAVVVPILTDLVFVNVFSLILPTSRLF
ncbi:Tripartite tricarboxylate transporter TctB family [Sphaerochaeta pleomorpha str. Grapes]|uniref:Tripartite tricarboxylate transporter TctB family n=1 Tax=Sphaerochaeta pleomorpha (strain ATCC BAA-1885 / DSM 22778 / Grapes) TaxID=158190 RepID=G8QWU5_SPHPG|nr:tripartite tricarboxylate transporter TctB family protein [Sphaerochaeta pleomorpha]AEV28389.1 Tripartite tricarboxylate transporter TctB family [Sphaerochaeta pleomorpha str. Grapes]